MNIEAVMMDTVIATDNNTVVLGGKEVGTGEFLEVMNQLLGDVNPENLINNRKKEVSLEVLEQASAMLNQNSISINPFTRFNNIENIKDLSMEMCIDNDKLDPATYKINLPDMDVELDILTATRNAPREDIILSGNQSIIDTEVKPQKLHKVSENDELIKSSGKSLNIGEQEIQNKTLIDNSSMELDLQEQVKNIKRAENKSFELESGLVETVSDYENIQNPRIIHRAENEIDILKSAIILEGLKTVKDNVANQSQAFVQEANIKSNEISPNNTINDNSELESTRASIHQVVEGIKTTETRQTKSIVKPFGIDQKVEMNSLEDFEAKDLVDLNNNLASKEQKKIHSEKTLGQPIETNIKGDNHKAQNIGELVQSDERVIYHEELEIVQTDGEVEIQREPKSSQDFEVKDNVLEPDLDESFLRYVNNSVNIPTKQNNPLDYGQEQIVDLSLNPNIEHDNKNNFDMINIHENTANKDIKILTSEGKDEILTQKESINKVKNNFEAEDLELDIVGDNNQSLVTKHGDEEIELNAESKLFHAINSVKKSLKDYRSKAEEIIHNVDELQKNPSNIQFENFQKEKIEPKLIDEFDVQNQILDGLTNQFKIDFKEEFTIQLAPEGLGKVTVKFVKDADKIILNMTASSEATVKLLNERLVDLQNSLRLHNAEINNITVQKSESTSEQMMYNSLQQSFSNHHNFSGNDRNYFNNDNNKNYYYNSSPNGNETAIEEQTETIPSKLNSMLNVYV